MSLPGAAFALATCDANEDLHTFSIGAANATTAAASTRTWANSSTSNTYPIGTGLTANTITFTATRAAQATWTVPGASGGAAVAPRNAPYGGYGNSLALAMDTSVANVGTTLTLVFNRPMDKVQFVMTDVDYSQGANEWQDVLRVSGTLNGNAVVAPTFTPVTPGLYTIDQPVAGTRRVTARSDLGNTNCANTDASCNVTIDFPNPVESIAIGFYAGAAYANPDGQVVSFQSFSYCVPKRDLSLVKADTTTTFALGTTGTYTLTITNEGGAATLASPPLSVVDVLPAGLTFVNPQAPGGGWACTLSNTISTDDTATCTLAAPVLAANSSTVLTLTVLVSPTLVATSVDNRAKVYGGGDPNKAASTTTGPVASCAAANEGWSSGGALFASGATTNSGCAFETTLITNSVSLAITKSDGVAVLPGGSTTTYTITVANSGPSAAPGSLVRDPAAPGLNCTTVTFAATPAGAVSTPTLSISALQTTGLNITPTFAPNSTATFTVTCGVTATGQ